MAVILGGIKINSVNSGASFNVGELQFVSTHSKMNMQANAGSFNNGDANLINNGGSGIASPPILNDKEVAEGQLG